MIQNLDGKISNIEQKGSVLEHNQTMSKYQPRAGFALKQFEFLWNPVNEIACENSVPSKEAVVRGLGRVSGYSAWRYIR